MSKNAQKAFTLIELMLSITIIGILATSSFASVGKAREKARDVGKLANSRQMILALELYYDDFGGYPCDTIADNDDYKILVDELGKMKIMRSAPIDQGGSYHYYPSSTTTNRASDYVLGVKLENEKHESLSNDIDELIFGLNCEDPIYCVKP